MDMSPSEEEAKGYADLIFEEEDVEKEDLYLINGCQTVYCGQNKVKLWTCVTRIKGG